MSIKELQDAATSLYNNITDLNNNGSEGGIKSWWRDYKTNRSAQRVVKLLEETESRLSKTPESVGKRSDEIALKRMTGIQIRNIESSFAEAQKNGCFKELPTWHHNLVGQSNTEDSIQQVLNHFKPKIEPKDCLRENRLIMAKAHAERELRYATRYQRMDGHFSVRAIRL